MHPLKKYVYVLEFGGTAIILDGLLALFIFIAPNVVWFSKSQVTG